MYLAMQNQECMKASLKGNEQEEESLQRLLFTASGSNQLDVALGGALLPEDIFTTERNETAVGVDSWKRNSFNIPSLQCSTVSDDPDELFGNFESATTDVARLDDGRHKKTEDANDMATVPPLFRSTSSGLSVLLHWTTASFLAAKQQRQESHQNVNVQPVAPTGGAFSNGYFQESGYRETLPFQPNIGTGDDPSRKRELQDLLRSQRALYLDSLQKFSGDDPKVASMNGTTPKVPGPGEALVDPTLLHSPVTEATQAKKNACRKKRPTSSRAVRKLKLGRQRLRPMSAYNIFFKYERARIVGEPLEFDKITCTTKVDRRKRRKSPRNVIGFSDLGKLIGQRWKELGAEERAVYQEKARQDKMRYEAEKAAAEEQDEMLTGDEC